MVDDFSAASLHSVLARPLPRRRLVPRPVRLVQVRDVGHERVVRVRVREQRADGEQDLGVGGWVSAGRTSAGVHRPC